MEWELISYNPVVNTAPTPGPFLKPRVVDHAFLTVRNGVAPSLAEVEARREKNPRLEARREKNPRVTFSSRGIWQNTETVFIVTERNVRGTWCIEAKEAVQAL